MSKKCKSENDHKIIVFQENQSKLIIENPERLKTTKIIVDGCEITEGIRCDFLLLASGIEYYIELKGQDINHAIEQIERTLRVLSSDFKKQKKISLVISARCPLNSATIQNIRVKFRKNFNSDLIVRNSPFSYRI